jgi:hypothetical protein
MTKKHMKKCSTSLAIQAMQIKTTLTFHLIPVRMATVKNTINKCCGRWWGKEPSFTVGGNAN